MNRACYRQLARCFHLLYSIVGDGALPGTLANLISLVDIQKGSKVDGNEQRVLITKAASLHVLGVLHLEFPSKSFSLVPRTISICVKNLRLGNPCDLVKIESLTCMKHSVHVSAASLPAQCVKEVLRISRQGLQDKNGFIRLATAECLAALLRRYQSKPVGELSSEVEHLPLAILKAHEGASFPLRQALSRLFALVVVHCLPVLPRLPSSKSVTRLRRMRGKEIATATGQNHSHNKVASDPNRRNASNMGLDAVLEEAVLYVALLYQKHTAREARIGLVYSIAEILYLVYNPQVEAFYQRVIKCLFWNWLFPVKSLGLTWLEMNLLREQCAYVLREVMGSTLLDEDQRLVAAKDVVRLILTQWPPVLPGSETFDADLLICGLEEMASLLVDLGGVAVTLQEDLHDPLVTLLEHHNHGVRVSSALCLKCLCYSVPPLLPTVISNLFEYFQRELIVLGMGGLHQFEVLTKLVGYSYAASALISMVPLRPLYLSMDIATGLFDLCLQFLNGHKRTLKALLQEQQAINSGKSSRVSLSQMKAVWTIIGGLLNLGPNFVYSYLEELLASWDALLPDVATIAASNAPASQCEWLLVMFVQEAVMSTICCFVKRNECLLNDRTLGRLGTILHNIFGWITYRSSSSKDLSWSRTFSKDAQPSEKDTRAGQSLPGGPTVGLANLSAAEGFAYSATHQSWARLPNGTAWDSPIWPYFAASFSEVEEMWLSQAFSVFCEVNRPDIFEPLHGALMKHVSETLRLETRSTCQKLFDESDYKHLSHHNEELSAGVASWYCYEYPLTSFVTPTYLRSEKWWTAGHPEPHLERQIQDPHGRSFAHNYAILFELEAVVGSVENRERGKCRATTSAVAAVDAAIRLFSHLFPWQRAAVQETTLESMLRGIDSACVNRVKGGSKSKTKRKRGTAAALNALACLWRTLVEIQELRGKRDSQRAFGKGFKSGKALEVAYEIAKLFLGNVDPIVRDIAGEVVGLCASLCPTPMLGAFISDLTESIAVSNSWEWKSGAAGALSRTHSYVGTIVSKHHFETTFSILHSLAAEPDANLRAGALLSLARLVNSSASATISPHLHATMLLATRVAMDERSGTNAVTDFADGAFGPVYNVEQAVARILSAVVCSLGPDLEAEEESKSLCIYLVEHFLGGSDVFLIQDTLDCLQNIILLMPESVDTKTMAPFLRSLLNPCRSHPLFSGARSGALACLLPLIQRCTVDVHSSILSFFSTRSLDVPPEGLETIVFKLLEDCPGNSDMKDTLRYIIWHSIQLTAPLKPSAWIDLCRQVLTNSLSHSKFAPKVEVRRAESQQGDEEESLSVAVQDRDISTSRECVNQENAPSPEQLRFARFLDELPYPGEDTRKGMGWKNQVFALECLHEVIETIGRGPPEDLALHTDLKNARRTKRVTGTRMEGGSKGLGRDFIVLRVADLIGLAFTAATSASLELRLNGITILEDVLKLFATTTDPDFEGVHLLEQYQAQITSALTPAFGVDSSPEVRSRACHVCAQYATSGITDDINTLNRVLRLLKDALQQCWQGVHIDCREFDPQNHPSSSHAELMVRMAVVSAWAGLALAQKSYLRPIVDELRAELLHVWISTIRGFWTTKQGTKWRTVSSCALREPGMFNPFSSGMNAVTDLAGPVIQDRLMRQALLPLYAQHFEDILLAIATLSHFIEDERDASILLSLCIEPVCGTLDQTGTILTCLKSLNCFLSTKCLRNLTWDASMLMDIQQCAGRLLGTRNSLIQSVVFDTLSLLLEEFPDIIFGSSHLAETLMHLHVACLWLHVGHSWSSTTSQVDEDASVKLTKCIDNLKLISSGLSRRSSSTNFDLLVLACFGALFSTSNLHRGLLGTVLIGLKSFVSQLRQDPAIATVVAGLIQTLCGNCESSSDVECTKINSLAVTFLFSGTRRLWRDSSIIAAYLGMFRQLLANTELQKIGFQCLRSLSKALTKENEHETQWLIYVSVLPTIVSQMRTLDAQDEALQYLFDVIPVFQPRKAHQALAIAISMALVVLKRASPESVAVSAARRLITDVTIMASQRKECAHLIQSMRDIVHSIPYGRKEALQNAMEMSIG